MEQKIEICGSPGEALQKIGHNGQSSFVRLVVVDDGLTQMKPQGQGRK